MPPFTSAYRHHVPCATRADHSSVQAIILAAGGGTRLNGYMKGDHKCQLRFGEGTLLDHQLGILEAHGIHDVCVVTGYNHEQVIDNVAGRALIIHNEIWADSNSLYSLSLAKYWVDRPLVVMNCDVLMHPAILGQVLATANAFGSGFAYDASSGDDEEHMKVGLNNGLLHAMSKQLDTTTTVGENVGVLCFGKTAAQRLFHEAEQVLKTQGQGVWMAAAVEQLARKAALYGVDIAGLPWTEIDFPEDLALARQEIWPNICDMAFAMAN